MRTRRFGHLSTEVSDVKRSEANSFGGRTSIWRSSFVFPTGRSQQRRVHHRALQGPARSRRHRTYVVSSANMKELRSALQVLKERCRPRGPLWTKLGPEASASPHMELWLNIRRRRGHSLTSSESTFRSGEYTLVMIVARVGPPVINLPMTPAASRRGVSENRRISRKRACFCRAFMSGRDSIVDGGMTKKMIYEE